MTKLVIAVSGINATDNPGPGVPIARSLKEQCQDDLILGLSYDLHDPGHYMPFAIDQSVCLPYPSHGHDVVFERLALIKKQYGLDLLIPSLDAELPLFIRYQNELGDQLKIKTFLPTTEQFEWRSKDRLHKIVDEIGCQYPTTRVIHSQHEFDHEVAKNRIYPIIVKGKYYQAYFAYDAFEAHRYGAMIANEWGFPLLLQEQVFGSELNLIGLGDGQGGHFGMLAIKKLKTTSQGKIWTGISIHHPGIMALAEAFVQKTKWRGPFELECIEPKSSQNSGAKLMLIEVNPRFPAWLYFATGCGMNLPARLKDFLLYGDADRTCQYEAGKYYVRYTYEIVTDLDKFQKLSIEGY